MSDPISYCDHDPKTKIAKNDNIPVEWGKARERVHVGFLSPPHTTLEEVERTFIFKHGYLHFHKQGGTKRFSLPLFAHMNGPLRFL